MKQGKLPAFQFYPGDWRKDPGVQSLSFHDRGVWFEIICLMHESEFRGKLILNGKPMPQDALARLLGLDNQILTKTIDNLLNYGVASLCDETAALICRRMLRDEEVRIIQKNFGKQGGNPALCENYNMPGFVYLIQRSGDGKTKIGISENPTRRLYRLRSTHKGQSLEMLGSFHVQDMGYTESCLHKKYASVADGEWFSIGNSEIEEIKQYLIELPHKGQSKDNETPSSSSSSSDQDKDKITHPARAHVRVDGFEPVRPVESPPPTTQFCADRALKVLNLYPSVAKKDGRPVSKSMHAQNLLAARIAKSPDYPWEEHAQLMELNHTPPDAHKWADTLPDQIALNGLRKSKIEINKGAANGSHQAGAKRFESEIQRNARRAKEIFGPRSNADNTRDDSGVFHSHGAGDS